MGVNSPLGYERIQGCQAKVMVRNAVSLHVGPSSVVLAWLLVFELLVRMAVVEKLVSCQHHGKSGEAPFLHIDILAVILLKCSNSAFRGKILRQYPA